MSDRQISRRGLLFGIGGGALAGGVIASGAAAAAVAQSSPPAVTIDSSIAFNGPHQAGIANPAPAVTTLTALNLRAGVTTGELRQLMAALSTEISGLTSGRTAADDTDAELLANGPAGLTVTVSAGPGFFARDGLRNKLPDGLRPLPAFHKDALQPAWTGGDLLLQVCGDDSLIVAHTARRLTAIAADFGTVHWVQRGFGRAAALASDSAATGRNLMGQLDGTGNPHPADADFGSVVWTDGGAGHWTTGGSFIVIRRMRMLLDHWHAHSRDEQEKVIGRRKDTGAPLTGTAEFDQPDFSAQRADGSLVIPADAHVRLAHPSSTRGARILRRSYSYDDGFRADGQQQAGLIFIAWQADPRKGFVPIQARLDVGDALNHMVSTEGSAIGFAFPGVPAGGYLGQGLFEG